MDFLVGKYVSPHFSVQHCLCFLWMMSGVQMAESRVLHWGSLGSSGVQLWACYPAGDVLGSSKLQCFNLEISRPWKHSMTLQRCRLRQRPQILILMWSTLSFILCLFELEAEILRKPQPVACLVLSPTSLKNVNCLFLLCW